MTVGDLKKAIASLDNWLEIEIIVADEDADGDEVERSFNLETVTRRMDPDTAREYARFECGDA